MSDSIFWFDVVVALASTAAAIGSWRAAAQAVQAANAANALGRAIADREDAARRAERSGVASRVVAELDDIAIEILNRAEFLATGLVTDTTAARETLRSAKQRLRSQIERDEVQRLGHDVVSALRTAEFAPIMADLALESGLKVTAAPRVLRFTAEQLWGHGGTIWNSRIDGHRDAFPAVAELARSRVREMAARVRSGAPLDEPNAGETARGPTNVPPIRDTPSAGPGPD